MSSADLETSIVIGLGSNIKAVTNLRKALREIKKIPCVQVLNVANIYESDAQLPDGAPTTWSQKFLNSAVLISMKDFEPLKFLEILKKIENKMGRQNKERWSPREIDLDILYIHGAEFQTDRLTVPHKELKTRPFALLPLLEVFPAAQVARPAWVADWSERPFRTQVSSEFFWPEFVGILNVTSDSFSDGGMFLDETSFKEQAFRLLESGADILDLGAESTRPKASSVEPALEFERLNQSLKWLSEIRKEKHFEISLDCRRPEVVAKILETVAIDYLNDVTGFDDPGMLSLLKQAGARGIAMHSLSIPPNQQQTLDLSHNPCSQLNMWWQSKLEVFDRYHLNEDQMIFDPGICFGKTPRQNFYILNHLSEFSVIKSDLFLGYSRKSFLAQNSNRPAELRDVETALVTQKINQAYTQYLRFHDIESQKMALQRN